MRTILLAGGVVWLSQRLRCVKPNGKTNFNVAFSNFGAMESPSSDGRSSISILNPSASRAASFIVCPLVGGAAARGASS